MRRATEQSLRSFLLGSSVYKRLAAECVLLKLSRAHLRHSDSCKFQIRSLTTAHSRVFYLSNESKPSASPCFGCDVDKVFLFL